MSRALMWSILGSVGIIVLACVVAAVILRLVRRWAKRTDTAVDDAVARHLSGPIRWAAPILLYRAVGPWLPATPLRSDPLRHALTVASILVVGWMVFRTLKVLEQVVMSRYDLTRGNNLHACSVHTQIRAFRNIAAFLVVLLTVALALMTFEAVRELGAGLLASAGVAGIVIGFAAQRSIATVVAGIQLALAQPVRIDDVVVIDGHWGRVEEIALTYVVIRIWDQRRLVVPVTRIMEQPFENWTRTSAELLGAVELELDFTAPIEPLREELARIVEAAPEWDGRVANVQVTGVQARSIVVRALVSAAESGPLWDLRCRVRERLIAFLTESYPEAIPRYRARLVSDPTDPAANEPGDRASRSGRRSDHEEGLTDPPASSRRGSPR